MGNICGSSNDTSDLAHHVSASKSDLKEPLAPSAVNVDVRNGDSSGSESGAPDWTAMNGTWVQDRHSNLDEYLTHQSVPWLIKKMIMKVKVRYSHLQAVHHDNVLPKGLTNRAA